MLLGLAAGAGAQVKTDAPPAEQPPRVLLDLTLRERPVRLVAVGPESLTVQEEGSRATQVARRDVLAIVPPASTASSVSGPAGKPSPRLIMADGQVLPGSLGSDSDSRGERLAWERRVWGRVGVALEGGRRVG